MISFKKYHATYSLLTEAKANTHLTHLEELVLTQGERGYGVARGFIADLLSHLQGKSKRKVNTSVKWDGAPAIFAGKHPETGKFFVGTKSIFNKDTIRYAVEADTEFGKEIGNSVFGIVFHTGYDDLNSPPQYNISVKGLKKVPGVWVDDAVFTDTTGTVTLDIDEAKQVKDLLKTVDKIKVNYKDLPSDLLNIYTNSEIQQGKYLEDSEMSFKKFIEWFKGRKEKQVTKLKSQAGKKRAVEAFNKKLAEIKAQEKDIVNIFKVSRLLSQAKQIFVNKYNNAVYNTKHFLDNEDGTLKTTAPEGYVAVSRAGDAVKLVDRLEFSRANFSGGQSSTPITR